MFQFTTTNVINSNFDVDNQDMNRWAWSADDNVFTVKGVGSFKAENVKAIYKAPATDAQLASIKVDLDKVPSDLEEGTTLRLSIYVRLTQADQSSYYANDYQYKGRPFTVEFPVKYDKGTYSAEETAKNLKKLIKKYGLMIFEKELIKSTVEDKKLVLKAVNEFQRFHSYKLEYYIDSKEPFGEVWKNIDAFDKADVVEGKEAFGDYGWVLRNLRLPTSQHTRAFAPLAHEMPIPGAKYKQITIEYCVNRGPLGLNAVGDTVKSVTTHVFFVNEALLAEGVEVKDFGYDKDGEPIKAVADNFESAVDLLAEAAKLKFETKESEKWVDADGNPIKIYEYTVVKEETSEEVQG